MSNKDIDTPNEVVSQEVEEPKSTVQQEADVDIDNIPIDMDEVEDVAEMSDSEGTLFIFYYFPQEDQIFDDKEATTDKNDGTDENVNTLEHTEAPSKLFKLPTSRIKSIVKLIPSVHMVNSEAIAAIGKATELFLKELVSESYQVARESGKKTLAIGHIEGVIQTLPQFEFLDGMLI
ncbi:unnamed protein product [Rodentolepis nana]|uniref:CBFD_NFYB_HMF domain-containing protein n=1 Tax=Rodentolepis nana TaxID=102285 RepID=A0A0R3TVM0_RODNA|nr:unnamed protein product [Rodentolepis nana]